MWNDARRNVNECDACQAAKMPLEVPRQALARNRVGYAPMDVFG